MKRTVMAQGQPLVYELTRKAVRNINVRVRADGSVAVSAPPWVTTAAIEAFLCERQAAIRQAVARANARNTPLVLQDGAAVPCFGEPCRLCVVKGAKNRSALVGEVLTLTVTDPTDEALVAAVWERWKRTALEEWAMPVCRKVQTVFAAYGVPMPTVSFRKMKTRWGSCHPTKHKITLNTELACHNPQEITYVICHEFTHFLHADHSTAFYQALEKVCPDWKRLRASLNA